MFAWREKEGNASRPGCTAGLHVFFVHAHTTPMFCANSLRAICSLLRLPSLPPSLEPCPSVLLVCFPLVSLEFLHQLGRVELDRHMIKKEGANSQTLFLREDVG